MNEDEVSRFVVDSAIEVHRSLGGPGLLESIYEAALDWELRSRGIAVARQVQVPIVYKGRRLKPDFRLDLLVEDKVVVECKASHVLNSAAAAQALTYLRLMNLKLAIVINFGEILVSDGIRRVVNRL